MRTFEVGDFVTSDLNIHGEPVGRARLYVVIKVLRGNTYLIASKRWGIKEEHVSNLALNDDNVPRPHLTPSVIAGYWIQRLIECIPEEVEQ